MDETSRGESQAESADVLRRTLRALTDRQWEDLRLLLHPYIRWTASTGTTIHGRTNVIEMLKGSPDLPQSPATFELRDGQLYRWSEERPPRRL